MQLKNIKGVGDKTLFKLEKLGIKSIDDLVRFMPKFYWDMTKEGDLLECDHGDYILLRGTVIKKNKPVSLRRGFSPTSSRPVTGGPDFRAFLIAQLPLSLLLTRKRVFVFFQTSFVLHFIFYFLLLDIFLYCSLIQANCTYIISLRPKMSISIVIF